MKVPAYLSHKSKALAGALAGLLSAVAAHVHGGGSLESIATSGAAVLELVVSMAVGYLVVYFFPANGPKDKK